MGGRHRTTRGFTLLEVLVAIAILGLGLTVVLSAQTGVFWSYSRATHMSQAPGLLRCKMSELEVDLLVEGFPLIDQSDEGDCCEDSDIEGYRCSWTVETVELPELDLDGTFGGDAGAPIDGVPAGESGDPSEVAQEDVASAVDTSSDPLMGGPLGALMGMSPQTSASAAGVSSMGDMAALMGGGGGLAAMVMSMVYPDLKPMLEASIRKLTVTVHWKEGRSDRDFAVTQYVTNPISGGISPVDDAVADAVANELDRQEGSISAPSAGAGGR